MEVYAWGGVLGEEEEKAFAPWKKKMTTKIH